MLLLLLFCPSCSDILTFDGDDDDDGTTTTGPPHVTVGGITSDDDASARPSLVGVGLETATQKCQ